MRLVYLILEIFLIQFIASSEDCDNNDIGRIMTKCDEENKRDSKD